MHSISYTGIVLQDSRGENCTKQGGLSESNPVRTAVLGTVRREAGHCKRWQKVLKTKLAQEPSDLSLLRSDGS
jgi:hypothetical protein